MAFVCGTDDHGAPIELKALKQGITPDELTRFWNVRDQEDFTKADIVFDYFGTTKSDEHRRLVYLFYERLKKGGYFYRKRVQHAYCPKDQRFLPDRYVKGTCPHCGSAGQYGDACESCGRAYSITEVKDPTCSLCGTTPEPRESEHLFFKLSAFESFLSSWLSTNPYLPSDVVAYVKKWVEAGLQDWDITRDAPYYGIEMPDEPGKFFYVWHDAFIAYVSTLAELEKKRGGRWEDWWGANTNTSIVHFIGKDIVYHHFLFWPAMLKGAGFQLPLRLPVRGYLNLEQEKMSKSRGTLIEVREMLKQYPADFLRYYLTATTPNNVSDSSFSYKEFKTKVNSEFLDSFGNYAYRVLSFINRRFGGAIPAPTEYTEADRAFEQKLNAFAAKLEKHYEELEFKGALEGWLSFAGECNQYLSSREPWRPLEKGHGSADTILYLAAKGVYALALAGLPVTPNACQRVIAQLGLSKAPVNWGDYSAFAAGLALNQVEIIYPKIEDPTPAPKA